MGDVLQDLLASLKTVFINEGVEMEGCNSVANVSDILAFTKGYVLPKPLAAAGKTINVPDNKEDFDTLVFDEFVSMNERIRQSEGQDDVIMQEIENWRKKWLRSVSPSSSRTTSADSSSSVVAKNLEHTNNMSRKWRWMPLDGKHTIQKLVEKPKPRVPLLTYSQEAFMNVQTLQQDCEEAIKQTAPVPVVPGERDSPVNQRCSICHFSSICLNCTLTKKRNPLYQQEMYLMMRIEMCKAIEDIRTEEENRLNKTDADYEASTAKLRGVYNKLVMREPWVEWLCRYDADMARITRETDERILTLVEEHEQNVHSLRAMNTQLENEKRNLQETMTQAMKESSCQLENVKELLASSSETVEALEAEVDIARKVKKVQTIFTSKRNRALNACTEKLKAAKARMQENKEKQHIKNSSNGLFRDTMQHSLLTMMNSEVSSVEVEEFGSESWINGDEVRQACATEWCPVFDLVKTTTKKAVMMQELLRKMRSKENETFTRTKEMEIEIDLLNKQLHRRSGAGSVSSSVDLMPFASFMQFTRKPREESDHEGSESPGLPAVPPTLPRTSVSERPRRVSYVMDESQTFGSVRGMGSMSGSGRKWRGSHAAQIALRRSSIRSSIRSTDSGSRLR